MPLVLRLVKGSRLTHAETDGNFSYLDTKVNTLDTQVIKKDGSVVYTGSQDMGGNRTTNLGTPVNPNDGARLVDLQAIASGLFLKRPVKVATDSNISLSGTQTIQSVNVFVGDSVLVKNQSTPSQNGIYVCAAGAWTRRDDADTSGKVLSGMFVGVNQGIPDADSQWVLITDATIVLGTTNLTFEKWTVQAVSAGGILSKSGNSTIYVYFQNHQIPAGAVDGLNTTFLVSPVPIITTVQVFKDGILMDPTPGTPDYSISGSTITFTVAPTIGSKIRVSYFNS